MIIHKSKDEITICMCQHPAKKYSTEGCTCRWSCTSCGKFGGCDNQASSNNGVIIYNLPSLKVEPNFIWN